MGYQGFGAGFCAGEKRLNFSSPMHNPGIFPDHHGAHLTDYNGNDTRPAALPVQNTAAHEGSWKKWSFPLLHRSVLPVRVLPYTVIFMRKFTVLLTALLVLTASPVIPDEAPEGDNGPYPIWLSPLSPVQSLDQIDEEWTRLFGEGVEDREESYYRWTFYKGEGADTKTAIAEDCKTIFILEKQGYTVFKGSGRQVYEDQRNRCDFLDRLRRATPATVSFVRDIELNEHSVDILPAFFGVRIGCDIICRYAEANRRGVPISRFWPLTKITSPNGVQLHFDENDNHHSVFILAKGDFNGDGLEDLFVNSSFSFYVTSLITGDENFVLTRDQAGAVLRVVNPETHLCSVKWDSNYHCDESHSDLSFWLNAPH